MTADTLKTAHSDHTRTESDYKYQINHTQQNSYQTNDLKLKIKKQTLSDAKAIKISKLIDFHREIENKINGCDISLDIPLDNLGT
jgi:hypothetical protein